jgi:hypothetical protein
MFFHGDGSVETEENVFLLFFTFQGCGLQHISAHSDGKFEHSDDYGGGEGSGFHPPATRAIKSVNRRHS